MWSNELFRKIKTAVADFCPDVIHVEHLRMTPYALHFVDRYPSLWNAVDNIGVLYRQAISLGGNLPLRWIARLEAPRLEQYERWLISQFPVTTVITERDQQLFQQDNTYADRVQVVELGFPIPDLSTVQRDLQTLVITGTLNYHPNIASVHHFMAKIYPLIVQQFPAVHLQLVGANPDPTIQAYRSKNVEITGFVDSVTSYLEKSTIAMAPVLYGSGMQIKVIEAFLTATPLVATQIALRGLDVRDGEHVLIADTPEEFTRAILRLLGDSALRHRLGMAGREYVEKHHDLRITTQKLVEAYRIAIAQYQGI
jgi:glycosyltransferase involved in cell wall biosynthesis